MERANKVVTVVSAKKKKKMVTVVSAKKKNV